MPRVSLHEKIEISPVGLVALTEIAEISGLSDSQLELASQYMVALPKQPATLTARKLSMMLRGLSGQLGQRVQILIPDKMKVEIVDRGVSEAWVRNVLDKEIRRHCKGCDYQISRLKFPVIKGVDLSRFRVDIRNFRGGSFRWPITFQGASKGERANEVLLVDGYLKLYQSAPVAVKALSVGDRIRVEDFKMERTDITHSSRTLAQNFIGNKLRRSIRPGSPIYQGDLAREKLLKMGETVSLIMERGNLEVRAFGTALADGDLGDVVNVRTDKTRKVVSGTVRGKGEVYVR